MNIRGIYKTSLLDFPGRICTVLFSGGCNLRCGFCHNPDLALNSKDLPQFLNEEVLQVIEKRSKLIDGVTLSGGEPTLTKNLSSFCSEIKAMNLQVKLDTNGLKPQVVSQLISDKLIDYVAVDIKTSPEKYSRVTGADVDFSAVAETVDLLKNSPVAYELRTTCVPGDVTKEDLEAIGGELGSVNRYFLQQYVASGPLLDVAYRNIQPYDVSAIRGLGEVLSSFAEEWGIRGI